MNLRLSRACTLTVAVSLAAMSVAAAQTPSDADAPRFVVRISRPFFAQLTEKPFVGETPFRDLIQGAAVEGNAQIDGRFSVKLPVDTKVDSFVFLVRGQVASRSIARSGRIAVHTEGQAQFDAVRPVALTGNEFVGRPARVTVAYRSQLNGITTHRGGPFSRLVSRIAYSPVVRSMPGAERMFEAKLRDQLTKSVTSDSDEILRALNRVTGVAATVVRLQKAWSFSNVDLPIQLAGSDQYLLMGIASHEQALAELPVLREQDRAPMEVWIRRLVKKNELNLVPALRLYWLALGPVLTNLTRSVPELAEVVDNIQVTELADWRVVRLYLNPLKKPTQK